MSLMLVRTTSSSSCKVHLFHWQLLPIEHYISVNKVKIHPVLIVLEDYLAWLLVPRTLKHYISATPQLSRDTFNNPQMWTFSSFVAIITKHNIHKSLLYNVSWDPIYYLSPVLIRHSGQYISSTIQPNPPSEPHLEMLRKQAEVYSRMKMIKLNVVR